MSAALRLLVRFLLWTILLLIAGSLLIVAYRFVTGYAQGQTTSGEFLVNFLAGAGQLLVPAILVGSAICLFGLIRENVDPRIGIPVLLILWTGALAGAAALMEYQPVQSSAPLPTLPSERIVRIGATAIYVGDQESLLYEPVVVHDSDGYVLHDRGQIDPATSSFRIAGESFPLAEFGNTYASAVDRPEQIAAISADTDVSASYLRLSDLVGLMHIAGLSLFLLGTWTLVRLTRWPLFNLVGVLLALRFALWVIPAVNDGVLRSLVIVALSSQALPYVSAGLLGGLGVALFLTSVLLPPLESFKREIAG